MDHLRYKKIPQEMFVILQQFHLFVFVAHAYNDDCLCNSSCTHCKSNIPYLIKKQLPSYLWENVFYLLSSKFPNMFRKPSIRSSTYCTIAQVNLFPSITCLFGSHMAGALGYCSIWCSAQQQNFNSWKLTALVCIRYFAKLKKLHVRRNIPETFCKNKQNCLD